MEAGTFARRTPDGSFLPAETICGEPPDLDELARALAEAYALSREAELYE